MISTSIPVIAGVVMKSSITGIVEIKKCGFNTRPKLMSAAQSGDTGDAIDILPDAFLPFEGKTVKVTIETLPGRKKGRAQAGGDRPGDNG